VGSLSQAFVLNFNGNRGCGGAEPAGAGLSGAPQLLDFCTARPPGPVLDPSGSGWMVWVGPRRLRLRLRFRLLAREIMWTNDEWPRFHFCNDATPERRFERVRQWVASQLKD
jgi:hypothetical protein